jgi:16S rRNA (guanine527-N7)-methyltransferase
MHADLRELFLRGLDEWGLEFTESQTTAALTYATLVVEAQDAVNLTGIRSPEGIVVKHLLDSLACLRSAAVVFATTLVDVGSGGGFPAVPLALALPGCRVVAMESREKKAAFITSAARRCGITNLTVATVRSEDAARGPSRDAFDAAVCRALAAPEVALELCLPLVRPGGILTVLCGDADALDARRLESVAVQLGGGPPVGTRYRLPVLGHDRGLLEIPKVASTPARFPRKPGLAKKRPLIPHESLR